MVCLLLFSCTDLAQGLVGVFCSTAAALRCLKDLSTSSHTRVCNRARPTSSLSSSLGRRRRVLELCCLLATSSGLFQELGGHALCVCGVAICRLKATASSGSLRALARRLLCVQVDLFTPSVKSRLYFLHATLRGSAAYKPS